jgi:hypothetical protein
LHSCQIGTPAPESIKQENATYGDIVELNIPESIDSGKTPTALRWASMRADDFVFKSDLDTFVSWPSMALLLPGPSDSEASGQGRPNGVNTPFLFFGQEHPKCKHGCAKGGLYMLSRSLLHWIVAKTPFVTSRRAEDKLTCEHIALAEKDGVQVEFRLFPAPMFFPTWVHRVKHRYEYLACNDTASSCLGEYANVFTKSTAASARAAAIALARASVPDTGLPPHPTQLHHFTQWVEKGLSIPPATGDTSVCFWLQIFCFYQPYIKDFAFLVHALRGAPGAPGAPGAAAGLIRSAVPHSSNGTLRSTRSSKKTHEWNRRQVSALRMLKQQLLHAPAHTCEVWRNDPPTLTVAMKVHKQTIKVKLWQGRKKDRPILYWSRRLQKADARMNDGVQECAALFIALHHLRPNVMGQRVKIIIADRADEDGQGSMRKGGVFSQGSKHVRNIARPWLAQVRGFRSNSAFDYDSVNAELLRGCIEGFNRQLTAPGLGLAERKRLTPGALAAAYGDRTTGTCSSGIIAMDGSEPACDAIKEAP